MALFNCAFYGATIADNQMLKQTQLAHMVTGAMWLDVLFVLNRIAQKSQYC